MLKASHNVCFFASLLTTMLLGTACTKADSGDQVNGSVSTAVSKWFNPQIFDGGGSRLGLYEPLFDISFDAKAGGSMTFKQCSEVLSSSGEGLHSAQYARWTLLRADCKAVDRYDRAPDTSRSFWVRPFDFELLRTFPATASPEIGGEVLEGLQGMTFSQLPGLKLLESTSNSVEVEFDEMTVRYTLVSRGDFNWDDCEDLFIRLDYSIQGAMGSAVNWIVVTQRSDEEPPFVVWRE